MTARSGRFPLVPTTRLQCVLCNAMPLQCVRARSPRQSSARQGYLPPDSRFNLAGIKAAVPSMGRGARTPRGDRGENRMRDLITTGLQCVARRVLAQGDRGGRAVAGQRHLGPSMGRSREPFGGPSMWVRRFCRGGRAVSRRLQAAEALQCEAPAGRPGRLPTVLLSSFCCCAFNEAPADRPGRRARLWG